MRLFGTFVKRVIGSVALEVSAYRYMRQMIRETEKGASKAFYEGYSNGADSRMIVSAAKEIQTPATH